MELENKRENIEIMKLYKNRKGRELLNYVDKLKEDIKINALERLISEMAKDTKKDDIKFNNEWEVEKRGEYNFSVEYSKNCIFQSHQILWELLKRYSKLDDKVDKGNRLKTYLNSIDAYLWSGCEEDVINLYKAYSHKFVKSKQYLKKLDKLVEFFVKNDRGDSKPFIVEYLVTQLPKSEEHRKYRNLLKLVRAGVGDIAIKMCKCNITGPNAQDLEREVDWDCLIHGEGGKTESDKVLLKAIKYFEYEYKKDLE